MRVTDVAEAELVDAQGRVASAKAGYDQALAERAAALRRWFWAVVQNHGIV